MGVDIIWKFVESLAGGALLFVYRRSDGCVEELKSYYTHVYHSRGKEHEPRYRPAWQ